ncbi:MAG: sulfatase-like hydrolase/transferase [Candidatus Rokubacteria bacterium]|nr:sulfatase-like hydrolase/transferase [Candidatus Rokubacteria bacterium]
MRPTNVLFVLSDEHSRRILGCYGNPVVRTPNLDALAARGTRFASAYCQTPICVPSRASLATGRYAHAVNSWDNATPYVGPEAPSWGHRLTAQGHTVTTIGKLHYRRAGDPSGFPDQRVPMHVVEGVGDLYGLLRGDMPPRPHSRRYVVEARPGESEYIRYDRAIAEATARWLAEEAGDQRRPWVLFVGFVSPHFPLVVPERYFNLYPLDSVPLPVQHAPEAWPRHPVIDLRRRQQALEEPLDEKTLRKALAAYYGLVSFLDEQVGIVLDALSEAGLAATTRVMYSTDHGELLGDHGLWWKSAMYESSVAVPLIMAGPDVPRGHVVRTNAMLVDIFPTLVEAVGARLADEDRDLPGESLIGLAREVDRPRTAFSEYHAIMSPSGTFMLRTARYKYVHYVGYPPQLFDLAVDPDETRDLGTDPQYADVRAACVRELRGIVDTEQVDARAKADQRRRIEVAGGVEAILAGGAKIAYTPAPGEFDPAPFEATRRAPPRPA